jgi:hypothetical protein
MRKTAIALLALGLVVATTAYASNPVRISQVYGGGGGGSTCTYKYDYVELFNNSGCPVDIGGWSLQYGSATGSFASNSFGIAVIPVGATIPACGYYLIRCGSAGSGGADLPTAYDFANAVGPNLAAGSGKVALFTDQVTMRDCPAAKLVAVDLVGYGTANCYEGTAAVGLLSGTTVALRGNAGATDTDQNSTDFTVPLVASVTIHNSSSPRNHYCEGGPVGACCLPPIPTGGCIIVSAAQCASYGGIYIGDWTICTPDPCPATPTKGTTWGQVKTIYK